MRCRNVPTNIARVLSSDHSNGQDGVLRYDQVNDDNDCRCNVVRHATFARHVRRANCDKALLAGDCVGTVCEFSYFVIKFLVRGHVCDSENFSNLAIPSGRLALSAPSEGRNVRELRPYLRELIRELARSRSKDFALRERFTRFPTGLSTTVR